MRGNFVEKKATTGGGEWKGGSHGRRERKGKGEEGVTGYRKGGRMGGREGKDEPWVWPRKGEEGGLAK